MISAARDRKPLHVATAVNQAYLPWYATALLSAIQSSPDVDVRVEFIYDADVTSADTDRLGEMLAEVGASLRSHRLDQGRLTGLPEAVAAHGGPISCARLVVADLLPDVDRCLYLDADTLTVSSLGPLCGIDLEGVPLAAVRNVVQPHMRPRVRALGVADPSRYLNSGVLLMNLDHLRRTDGVDALLDFIHRRADELLWVDQDALNVVFDGQWLELHPRWNAQNSFFRWTAWSEESIGATRLQETLADPAILHFEGPSLSKPWHYLSGHEYRHRYRSTLAATPWQGVGLEDRTIATRLLAVLPWKARVPAYLKLKDARDAARRITRRGAR
ncbi:MAG: glycosyltransferase family 8 protein [Mycobacteriales bacterium]